MCGVHRLDRFPVTRRGVVSTINPASAAVTMVFHEVGSGAREG